MKKSVLENPLHVITWKSTMRKC